MRPLAVFLTVLAFCTAMMEAALGNTASMICWLVPAVVWGFYRFSFLYKLLE